MKKILAIFLLFIFVGCSASPKKMEELYADKTSYYSPAETIKCKKKRGKPEKVMIKTIVMTTYS